MLSTRRSCYCAFCKTERKVYANQHLSLLDVVGLVFFGIICTYASVRSLDHRGLLIIGILLVMGEAFLRVKWRVSMICRNCGFDPVLYVRNPEQAGLKIKAFLDKRAESPEHLLRLPVILPTRKEKTSKGKNLSLKM
jgi:hypothetical protein